MTKSERLRRLVEEDFPNAQKITLVMDNLNTHSGASLYKVLAPEVEQWVKDRNAFAGAVDWRFTAADARIKLKRLYPKIED